MKNTLSALFIRAKDIWQKEGLISLLRRGRTFLAQRTFRYGTYYLYEHTIRERNEADFMPKIKEYTFKIVHTNQETDELATKGFDFGSYSYLVRRNLDKGAIAFCVFVGRELAHIGWVALTQEAMDSFEPYPYHVDFLNGEACTGGVLTVPKYRKKGLHIFIQFKRFQFLRERGIRASRSSIATGNITAQWTID